MKSTATILLPVGRDAVWAALLNPSNRPRWQTGVVGMQPLSGTPGERGFVCQLAYDDGRADEFETIAELRYPDLVACVVESKRYRRTIVHNLDATGDAATRWRAWSHTTAGKLSQLAAVFRRSVLEDNLEQDMERFKLMMESDEAGRS